MKRGLVRLALLVCALLGLSTLAPAAMAAQSPEITSNMCAHDYPKWGYWAEPSHSGLAYDEANKVYTRVEYTGEYVVVETYDEDFAFLSGRTIAMELPIYGGFHSGESYNFLIFGQENPTESDTTEVIRVVKYDKNWNRLGQASLLGGNTTVPFDASSLSTAEYNGYLYIRTGHEMYTSSDGLNHQSNLTMNVRISDMEITDSFYGVMNADYGYVSHSFCQFIAVDEAEQAIVAVDHGDANPRAVTLTKYCASAGQDSFMEGKLVSLGNGSYTYKYADHTDVLPIMGSYGDNATGVSLGGFAISDSSYLTVGTSVPQVEEDFDTEVQRNVFLTVTDKDLSSTKVVWLTDYEVIQAVDLSNPYIVPINSNKFMILWVSDTTYATLNYLFVDGQGNRVGTHYTKKIACNSYLSDCQPILADGKVVWYMTGTCEPVFFTIDPEDPDTVIDSHVMQYSTDAFPTETEGSTTLCECLLCGYSTIIEVPALSSGEYTLVESSQPTCEEEGVLAYQWVTPFDEVITVSQTTKALGHDYGEWTLPGGAVCGNYVRYSRTCSRCKEAEYKTVWYSHDYQLSVVEPTCEEWGHSVMTCSRCGDNYILSSSNTSPTGHDWGREVIKGVPCAGTGYGEKVCGSCGEVERTEYNYIYDHSYVENDGPECTYQCEWCGAEKGHWYWECYGTEGLYECRYCEEFFFQTDSGYEPHTHSFGDWQVDLEPTETDSGAQTHWCTVCGYGEQVTIPPASENPFEDVSFGVYYYDPVLWAVEEKITTGTDATHFSPGTICTRAQVVTFLWRAAGSPTPGSDENPFVDVNREVGYWYYDAVLWAIEKGITIGMDDTHFAPDEKCTRAQVCMFLWRTVGEPSVTGCDNPFADVAQGQWFYAPVIWAVDAKVTNGITPTTFVPNDPCTRGQIVTFLYRAMAE